MPPAKSKLLVSIPDVPHRLFLSDTKSNASSDEMSTQHVLDNTTQSLMKSQDEASAVESSGQTLQSSSIVTERGEDSSKSGMENATNKINIALPPVPPDWFIASSASVDSASLPPLKAASSSSHLSEEEEIYSAKGVGFEVSVSDQDENRTTISFSAEESNAEQEESTKASGTGITDNYSVYVGGSASTVSSTIEPLTTSSSNDGNDSHTLSTNTLPQQQTRGHIQGTAVPACPGDASLSSRSQASRTRISRQDRDGETGRSYIQNMRDGPPVMTRSQSSGSITMTADDLMEMAHTNNALSDAKRVNALNDFQDGEINVSPFECIPYVHGGYAAAAPLMLYDLKWMGILRRLMPESYADAMSLIKKSDTSINACMSTPFLDQTKIMKWAENNPVVAAYGMLKSDGGRRKKEEVSEERLDGRKYNEASRFTTQRRNRRRTMDENSMDAMVPPSALQNSRGPSSVSSSEEKWVVKPKPALEWDVFLDPNLVKLVDVAMDTVEVLAEKEARGVYVDQEERMAADVEVDRQVGRLLSRMMLCHGSTVQLVAEAVGVAPRYNFARVVKRSVARSRARNISMFRRLIGSRTQREDIEVTSSSSVISTPSVQEEEKDVGKKGPTIEGATGIFVERWLYLFSKALELGHPTNKRNSARSNKMSLSPSSVVSRAVSPTHSHASGQTPFGGEGEIDIHPYPACGIFLCLGMEDRYSLKADHGNSCMAGYANNIKRILGEPLRLVLDMKSRRVPPRVWARLIDNLRSRGLGVDGVGSFDLDEPRLIESHCSTTIDQILFFHSAGDLQRACHAKAVKHGDTVYFNAGSLFWKKPGLIESATSGCTCTYASFVDEDLQGASDSAGNDQADLSISNGLYFQPYAYPREKKGMYGCITPCKSTLQDYQIHLDLKIGVYVQEFSVGPDEIDAIAKLVNEYPSIYNLGLAWGGINGKAIGGVSGDGYWNQRFMGRKWDFNAVPKDSMELLNPEDHHMVQKALQAGAWAQVGTVLDIGNENDVGRTLNGAMCHPNKIRS